MAYVISDECISCGSCESGCPVGAISQGADHYEIDAGTCISCGACSARTAVSDLEPALPSAPLALLPKSNLWRLNKQQKGPCRHGSFLMQKVFSIINEGIII